MINLGDVILQDGDIFGDGVNIAARIEAICEAGGVAISGTAHENIAGRIEVEFIDLGNQQLKNIAIETAKNAKHHVLLFRILAFLRRRQTSWIITLDRDGVGETCA